MKCTVCLRECFNAEYPEVVFKDDNYCVCEDCSIDYEQVDGKVQFRKDLVERGYTEILYCEA